MEKRKAGWILAHKDSTIPVKILRWVARIWSLFALTIALMVVFTPDPYQVRPITPMEVFMLSFWGVAILGLVLAWRWERFGAMVTIITMPVRELVYFLMHRTWIVNFLLIWALVIPPAILYLIVSYLDQKKA
jgi:hypothetical protein